MRRRTKRQIGRGRAAAIQPVASSHRWPRLIICVSLVAVTWFVFGQTLHFEFINFDDGDYVFKNSAVTRGLTLSGIAWAFTGSHAANWHPLTWISHMLDCQLYGLNSGGHHLTNVLIHATSAVLLFLVLQRTTGALWRSAFVAALFAIHPSHVESVAWVSERKDVLSGLFFILTIGAYVRYARGPRSVTHYALVVVLFACGLMSKPMLVTVPLVLLLLDYWPLNRFASPPAGDGGTLKVAWRLLLEKAPLFVLSLASCVVTVFAQTEALQVMAKTSLSARTGNAVVACKDYLFQFLWPSNLAVFYPWESARLGGTSILLSASLLLGISAIILVARQRGYPVTGWFWYLVMLVPVIGIVQVGNQMRADRYTYLPYIGLSVLLTWIAADLFDRWRWPYRRLCLAVLAAILLAGLAISAHLQASVWRNSESLWNQALSRTTDNVVAELNLGEAVLKLGRTNEALAHFERVLQIEPNEPMAHAFLGSALLKIGQTNAALAHLQKSLEIQANQSSVHSSLGVVLMELGRLEESLSHLQTAVKIDPENGEAHYNLGNTFLQMRQVNEAVAEYKEALRLNPDDTEALNNLAWILATSPDALTRDGAKAVELAERADALTRGQSPIVGATLAAAYAEAGRLGDALKSAQRSLQLAHTEGNGARVDSIRAQIEVYQSGAAFRDRRYAPSPR